MTRRDLVRLAGAVAQQDGAASAPLASAPPPGMKRVCVNTVLARDSGGDILQVREEFQDIPINEPPPRDPARLIALESRASRSHAERRSGRSTSQQTPPKESRLTIGICDKAGTVL